MKDQSRLKALIEQQDLIRPHAPSSWTDGLFLGNGALGAVSFGTLGMEWLVNKNSIFQARLEQGCQLSHKEVMDRLSRTDRKCSDLLSGLEQPSPYPLTSVTAAHLRLKCCEGAGWFMPATPELSQHLSLFDGELRGAIRKSSMDAEVCSLIPRDTNTLCIRFEARNDTTRRRSFFWEFLRPVHEDFAPPCWHETEDCISFIQHFPGEDSSYAVALKLVPRDGGNIARSKDGIFWRSLRSQGDTDAFLTVCSSRDFSDPLRAAEEEAARCAADGWDRLRSRNAEWWHDYWTRSWAEFASEPEIQKYWIFSLYEIAAAFGKAPMPGLNGLTYGPMDVMTPGPGVPYYTHDQNIQIAMMPFMPLNRCEFISAMADTYLDLMPEIKAHTRKLFDCDGACLPVCMLQDGREVPVGSYRYTLCGSAYSGAVLALAWRYSRNELLLQTKIYPLLKEFIRFYLSIMHRDEDGVYHLDWTVPPEIFTMTRDDSCTISLLHLCLETAVEAAHILKQDSGECRKWEEVLAHYPRPARRQDGAWWCGPDIPEDHCMYGGHLFYPFFPSEAWLDAEAARKTLAFSDNFAMERSHHDHMGKFHYVYEWAAFNATAVRQRLEGPGAWPELRRYLELFAKPNGLFSHNAILVMDTAEAEENARRATVFTLKNHRGEPWNYAPAGQDATENPDAKKIVPAVQEGSSAFAFLAAESLLQSWGGIIRIFPCVPTDFDGAFHRLLAQGGFEVSAEMRHGAVTSWSVHALHGGTFRLKLPGNDTVITADLAPGETIDSRGNRS